MNDAIPALLWLTGLLLLIWGVSLWLGQIAGIILLGLALMLVAKAWSDT